MNNPTVKTTKLISIPVDTFNALCSDAYRFRFLQNLPAVKAQQYFWNYVSRKQRAKMIDADMAQS